MLALDTNVLVRLITRDEPGQTAIAAKLAEEGAWISLLVLGETVWVLANIYGLTDAEQANVIGSLLEHRTLVVQDSDAAAAALARFRARPRLGFYDCLILETARKAGHLPLGTFDRLLAAQPGAEQIGGAA